MPFQPVHLPQPLLLVPPLLPPLVLRTENGQFGAKRPDIGRFGDCEPCSRFEEPPSRPPDEEDPRDPRLTRYVKHQVHEAVDLEGEAGDCVFAAYGGRVVEVETGAAGVRGNVTIDHHPSATGLVSRYLHLEGAGICVEEGDSVAKGDLIGRIGSGPADPHLHFEGPGAGPPGRGRVPRVGVLRHPPGPGKRRHGLRRPRRRRPPAARGRRGT
jgi:Peptidase family M23